LKNIIYDSVKLIY